MIRVKTAAILAACLALAGGIDAQVRSPQGAQAFSGWTSILLKNGPNELDIDGDGRQDLVFVAWRDNYNAHGYGLVTFYRRGPSEELTWELVPFFDAKPQGEDSFHTVHGADCQLRGIAVARRTSSPSEPITVVVGDRDFGRSFDDSASVTFIVYRVEKNADGTPGRPPVYLEAERTITSRSKYCDVNEAFAAELGIHTGA